MLLFERNINGVLLPQTEMDNNERTDRVARTTMVLPVVQHDLGDYPWSFAGASVDDIHRVLAGVTGPVHSLAYNTARFQLQTVPQGIHLRTG